MSHYKGGPNRGGMVWRPVVGAAVGTGLGAFAGLWGAVLGGALGAVAGGMMRRGGPLLRRRD